MSSTIPNVSDHIYRIVNERTATEAERQRDIEAYQEIVAKIANAKDAFAKRVYRQTLDFAADTSHQMRFSYIVDEILPMVLKEQRKARRELRPFALFAEIEKILAGATSTTNFGQSRRWPLMTTASYSKTRQLPRNVRNMEDAVLPANFRSAYYKFGVHSFSVGRAVEAIIDMIERRYSLDFKALEEMRQSNKRETEVTSLRPGSGRNTAETG